MWEATQYLAAALQRTPLGPSVTVHFSDDQAQDIKEALRKNSQVQGRITYNKTTSAIVSGDPTEIALMEQLVMPDVEDFWIKRSLDNLAEAQGVGVVESIKMLQDDTISEEEAEAFIAALEL